MTPRKPSDTKDGPERPRRSGSQPEPAGKLQALDLENQKLKAQIRMFRLSDVKEGVFPTVRVFIFGIVAICCTYLITDCLKAFVGKTTNAIIDINFFADLRFLAVLFGAGGIAYGTAQKRLRKKAEKQLALSEASGFTEPEPQPTTEGSL